MLDALVAQFLMAAATVFHINTPHDDKAWERYDTFRDVRFLFSSHYGTEDFNYIVRQVNIEVNQRVLACLPTFNFKEKETP